MPRGDRTGPAGAGPRTGRGLGYCAGYATPGYTKGRPRGGGGYGRGFGRGYGYWNRPPARPPYWNQPQQNYAPQGAGAYPSPRSEEEELQILEEEAQMLKNRLEEIEDRMDELEN